MATVESNAMDETAPAPAPGADATAEAPAAPVAEDPRAAAAATEVKQEEEVVRVKREEIEDEGQVIAGGANGTDKKRTREDLEQPQEQTKEIEKEETSPYPRKIGYKTFKDGSEIKRHVVGIFKRFTPGTPLNKVSSHSEVHSKGMAGSQVPARQT